MTEEQVFLAALDLPDRAGRTAYLDEVCGQNSELRRQVEELLAAHERSGQFLDQPAAEQMAPGPQIPAGQTIALDSESGDAVADKRKTNPSPSDDETDDLHFLSPSTRPDSLGRLGHYEMLQVLGKGGFGIVFRAFDDMLQRVVAVKVMAPQIATLSPARKRFVREARSSAAIRHDNVVHVYEVGESPLPYLVMEFIPGETLQQKLDRSGPLDVPEILRIGRQVAEGLAAAHACDLIHRDIKPGNILLEGGSHKAKITDFGLARAADDASISQSGIIAGTPMFMAPEQALGNKIDQRADLFSLGSVLYQMASGRPPFRAPSALAVLKRVAEETPRPIQEIIPETPDWLCGIIAKLHAKNPADRFQSAREVADLLADCEAKLKAKQEVRNVLPAPVKPVAATASGGRKWVAAAAVLLLPVIALAVTEFAGVTHLFRQQVTPVNGPVLVAKNELPPLADGWVRLFNGKDLTGWKLNPDQGGQWEVKDGILIGSTSRSHLFSERGDYVNFHLRAEAKINLGGNSGILFRAPFALRRGKFAWQLGPAGCYEAELQKSLNHPMPTGSVMVSTMDAPPIVLGRAADDSLTRPDEWFTLEIIAEQNRFITKVNGKETANCSDPLNKFPTGHFALQVWNPNTVVQFRKIEIKELPPSSPPRDDDWVPHFNGKDLTGWTTHPDDPSIWVVEDGAIVGRHGQSHLFTKRGDFQDFHLRAEAQINATGDGGVVFRTDFAVRPVKNGFAYTSGYEAQIAVRPQWPVHTGSLSWPFGKSAGDGVLKLGPLNPHRPDEWFLLEIIAQGPHMQVFVDGKRTVEFRDDSERFRRGHIALQTFGETIRFRKIEIKELPAKPEPLPPTVKNSIGMEFAIVPKGKSWLGGGKDKLGDKEVEIPADFYLGKYEVTQEEWEKVMGENPSYFSRMGEGNDAVKDITTADLKRFPVENVSWDQCQIFVAKLNKLEKETGWVYRLPKEAEWEYACRGGPMSDKLDSAFDFYFAKPTDALLPDQANFNRGLRRTCKVGSYESNRLGLFDMHGNVWEWCADTGKGAGGVSARGCRGGSWHPDSGSCQAAARRLNPPSFQNYALGLRLARVPAGAPSPEAKTPPVAKQELPPTFKNSLGMEFVIVPKGKSWLGGGKDKLGDKEVEIPADFYLGKYEVTQEEWEKVMGENPSHFSRTGEGKDAVKDLSDADLKRLPVENVSWDQCQIFVGKLNQQEKETGWVYRLPTEAEWEYACRGGPMANKVDSAFFYYFDKPTNTLLPDQVNFNNILKRTCQVGTYEPNLLSLHDMYGNVHEWCDDTTTAGNGATQRVGRGGGWNSASASCRAASRSTGPASYRDNRLGLRLARVPAGAPSP